MITHKHNKMLGFTMAEMLVVIVILGIAAMVVIPTIGNTGDLKVTAAGRQLVSALLYAQTSAISGQKQYQIVFSSTAESYELRDETGAVITNPINKTPYRLNFATDPHLKSIAIDSVDFDGNSNVWFDRLGIPHSGDISADIELSSRGKVILTADSHSIEVSVEPITGRINIGP